MECWIDMILIFFGNLWIFEKERTTTTVLFLFKIAKFATAGMDWNFMKS